MVGAKHLPSARRMPDGPKGKVTFDVHDPANRGQILRQHPGGRFVEQLVAGTDAKVFALASSRICCASSTDSVNGFST